MNGYSTLFAVLIFVCIAIILGTLALTLIGRFWSVAPPLHRHKLHHRR